MAIKAVLEVARADLNDAYGVTLWVREELTDLSPDDADALARELLTAAAEARRAKTEDERPGAFGRAAMVSGEAML